MKKKTLYKIMLPLLLIVLLPALFYTAYELNSLDEKEQMISEIYRQQLEAILFSVNQYAWDVTNNWAGEIDMAYQTHAPENVSEIDSNAFADLLFQVPAVRGVVLMDSLNTMPILCTLEEEIEKINTFRDQIQLALADSADLLDRLRRYSLTGYRKLEPIYLPDSTEEPKVLLFFRLSSGKQRSKFQYAGIFLEPTVFIREIFLPKLQEIAADRFKMAIFYPAGKIDVTADSTLTLADVSEKKSVWLFPQYILGIRPAGQSIEELAEARFYRNLGLLILLDLFLIGAAWFVYHTIRKQMELVRLKSDFVSNISHELRTPLALIRMFAETLELGRAPTEKRKQEYYSIIRQESERLTHLVNNILNFSRIEAGKKDYHFQPLKLNEITETVLKNYRFHLENEGFQFETALSDSLPEISGDSEAISEAVINLIDNSVKYSEEKKFIRIASGRENGHLFLEIADHGIGIAPGDQQKIFEKFHRVSDALVHNTKGSGLGLSLVKHIMEAHGGAVNVQSKPGAGSRFRLIFPMQQ